MEKQKFLDIASVAMSVVMFCFGTYLFLSGCGAFNTIEAYGLNFFFPGLVMITSSVLFFVNKLVNNKAVPLVLMIFNCIAIGFGLIGGIVLASKFAFAAAVLPFAGAIFSLAFFLLSDLGYILSLSKKQKETTKEKTEEKTEEPVKAEVVDEDK